MLYTKYNRIKVRETPEHFVPAEMNDKRKVGKGQFHVLDVRFTNGDPPWTRMNETD